MELWDVYDENLNLIRSNFRRRVDELAEGEYHLGIQLWIKRSDGKVLLTQRSEKKDKHKLKWECTGGAVQMGETPIIAMQREVKEEIGLDINTDEVKFIKLLKKEESHAYINVFMLEKDITLEDITFNDGEVIDAKFVDRAEFNDMYEKGEIVNYFKYLNIFNID
jgi:8-oxo-dGTP pyrophosphatase MutT (NUDIX family)